MDVSEDLKIIDRSISALNEAVGIYAKHVDHLIIDHVLQHPNWIGEIADSLFNFDVLFVGLTAPLSVIEERESRRANRQPGTARAQFEQMQKYEYDLLIDTSVLSPDEIADKIIANLVPGSTLKKYARINFYLLPP
jgi:chloramphenicol 3-O phosphotransferase